MSVDEPGRDQLSFGSTGVVSGNTHTKVCIDIPDDVEEPKTREEC